MSDAFLEVVDLHKRYGAVEALSGVSFEVHEGEIFGLLGPNGAGKTTLLSILSCLLEPTSGSARLLDRPLGGAGSDVRRLIGVVPQELAIYSEMTARENLQFFGELYGVPAMPLRQRVDEVLDAIGLADRARERVAGFSGGMKRRLNLGVGIVHAPRLLLLDEPTVGVDPQSRNRIFEEVRRLHESGMTIVYTSHYMEEVQTLCSRIGIMDQGRLVACDTLAGLLKLLPGEIRFRVHELSTELRSRILQLPGVRLIEAGRAWEKPSGDLRTDLPAAVPTAIAQQPGSPTRESSGRTCRLQCSNVQDSLLRLVAILQAYPGQLMSLEIEEPNLERVFLNLTGRGLRD
jgi:ABC-2 type transport system ATP-binding protein